MEAKRFEQVFLTFYRFYILHFVYASTISVCILGFSTLTYETRVYSFSLASSSSFLLRASLSRILLAVPFTPHDHTCLFKAWSMRTSLVPIAFLANALISLTARVARFLKVTLKSLLDMWMVMSRVMMSLALGFLWISALVIFVYCTIQV